MKKKISGKGIFNAIVLVCTVAIVIYFIFSKDGLKDLITSAQTINIVWLLAACLCHLLNSLVDCIVTYQFIRTKYKHISFYDSMKIALIGHFFSAVTPSSSGGQPMQVYAMSKLNIDAGFGSSIMIQKFLIFQITTTVYSLVVLLFKYEFIFEQIENDIMVAFIIVGVFSQLFITALLLIASFSPFLTNVLVKLAAAILAKLKIIKNVDKKIDTIKKQTELFHASNKELIKDTRRMVLYYVEIFIQITLIYAVPYCLYRCLNLSGASLFDIICSQSLVAMVSSMIPLPGASFGAEYSFSVFFAGIFTAATMKSTILLWRCITYYGTIIVCSPFALITKKTERRDMLQREIDEYDPDSDIVLPEQSDITENTETENQ